MFRLKLPLELRDHGVFNDMFPIQLSGRPFYGLLLVPPCASPPQLFNIFKCQSPSAAFIDILGFRPQLALHNTQQSIKRDCTMSFEVSSTSCSQSTENHTHNYTPLCSEVRVSVHKLRLHQIGL